MKGVPHFKKDGSLFKGKTHKMKGGEVHTGASHTKSSEKLFDLKDLPKKVRQRALVAMLKEKDKS